MKVVAPRESAPGERRVAITPETAGRLVAAGFQVAVQAGAGRAAGFADDAYREAGAAVEPDEAALYDGAGAVLRVRRPGAGDASAAAELEGVPEGAALIGFLQPFETPELVRLLAERRITAFAMELVPRITRAQRMDALSSQATVAGYKAALLAANSIGRLFPLLMTAAGTIPPARVLVVGAGVAGLQAIATCRRLGAVVEAFDIRPAAREEVESLGAKYVGLSMDEMEAAGGYAKEASEEVKRREHEILGRLVAEADVVITTAQVPGRRAPVLITEEMVAGMRAGSVIVDLASEAGGNCEVTRPGEEVEHRGVLVLGPTGVPSAFPLHASQMYARNVLALLQHLAPQGELRVDFEDEITAGCCVTHDGRVVHERLREPAAAGG